MSRRKRHVELGSDLKIWRSFLVENRFALTIRNDFLDLTLKHKPFTCGRGGIGRRARLRA